MTELEISDEFEVTGEFGLEVGVASKSSTGFEAFSDSFWSILGELVEPTRSLRPLVEESGSSLSKVGSKS